MANFPEPVLRTRFFAPLCDLIFGTCEWEKESWCSITAQMASSRRKTGN